MFPLSKQSRSRTVRKIYLKLLLFASVVLLLNRRFTQPQTVDLRFNIQDTIYVPAKLEKDILDNAVELGYASKEFSKGCTIWNEDDGKLYPQTQSYRTNLEIYVEAVQTFQPIPDLLKSIQSSDGSHDVCAKARPHPKLGLGAFFEPNQLSHTTSGYVEPITTPMRHPTFCAKRKRIKKRNIMSLNYLVHDFEAMCRKLKPTSTRVLIDLGASLDFHGKRQPEIVTLLKLYEKFGFNFDHIYAFEMTPADPTMVYSKMLPEKYFLKYHWINVGKKNEEVSFSFILLNKMCLILLRNLVLW